MKIEPERIYTKIRDRGSWGAGPWDDEPEDKVQWTDSATGLPCLAVRGPLGVWCGYVGVAESHPYFEKPYDDVDVDVHGGLTYADHCQEGPESGAVCHVPEPGAPDHVWWLGFDTAHSGDWVPSHRFGTDVYRTLAYVQAECTSLAEQIAAV